MVKKLKKLLTNKLCCDIIVSQQRKGTDTMIVYLVYSGTILMAIFRNEKKADEYIAQYGDEDFYKESWVTE